MSAPRWGRTSIPGVRSRRSAIELVALGAGRWSRTTMKSAVLTSRPPQALGHVGDLSKVLCLCGHDRGWHTWFNKVGGCNWPRDLDPLGKDCGCTMFTESKREAGTQLLRGHTRLEGDGSGLVIDVWFSNGAASQALGTGANDEVQERVLVRDCHNNQEVAPHKPIRGDRVEVPSKRKCCMNRLGHLKAGGKVSTDGYIEPAGVGGNLHDNNLAPRAGGRNHD